MVSVSTTARGMAGLRPPPIVPLTLPLWWFALAGVLAGATFVLLHFPRVLEPIRFGWGTALLFVAILATVALSSCGGGSGTPPPPSGTPAATYNLTVTSTVASGSATLTHNTTLTLTVN
jgi:hypothetical protein